ncbi:MBL fold metallo-hydrolase [Clostridium sp. PL3]|uniref:MBL fold metallo-hydrolase n=1 Tax=Clostridium thailandense TaxID=2794346 RepID=A0A949TT53_9CLOT|nr:MBL fold metallo-hydrolase [Clostridium thailandense]MBV7274887.1 MBL fold metallo-hydrolase [Clostridium thailandense]
MEKLVILGTGSAMVTKCYNTCFTLSKNDEHFLVDVGGGNTILSNLEKTNIPINRIHNVFISHSHNDHITGIIWVIRAVAQQILNENYEGNLHIYCHKEVVYIIKTISSLLLQKKFTDYIDNRILFEEISDDFSVNIIGYNINFFDIKSKKHLQFGFATKLFNGKTFTFLGDEPYNDKLYDYTYNVDYLMHEAFCLYSQRNTFKPYEKFHSTVKDACENASKLNAKNLILIHTEDNNIFKKKKLYFEEGRKYFQGNIIVPNDLEILYL